MGSPETHGCHAPKRAAGKEKTVLLADKGNGGRVKHNEEGVINERGERCQASHRARGRRRDILRCAFVFGVTHRKGPQPKKRNLAPEKGE